MNNFGGIYYINLDRRTDRRTEIEAEFAKMDISGVRFSAIATRPGIIGCGLSHLTILKEAREKKLKNVLIFEDDFEFLVDKWAFWGQIKEFYEMNIEYDVLMLSYMLNKATKVNDLIQRVYDVQTTSGYIVNASMYDRLIDLYEENFPLLESTGKHWIYAIDQIWKKLQGDASNWYAFNTRIGKQRPSMCDNGYEPQFNDYQA